MTLALAFTATNAIAADEDNTTSAGWALSAGLFDIGQTEKATEVGVEYRFVARRFWRFDLKPTLGVSGNEDGAFWAYGGFRVDFALGSGGNWLLTPNFAVSLYEQGDSKDLGHTLEFRSGLELARRLRNGHRLGLALYHLSNASISEDNPGEESLILSYSLGR